MNSFLKTVKETAVPSGGAAMWWLGQMGLLIKTGGMLLCVDYFASEFPGRQVPPPIPADALEGIDVFLGTHDHLDHIDHDAWRIWADTCPDALFVFPAAKLQTVLQDGIPAHRCRGLNDGESCRFGSVTVHAIAAAHEFLDRDPASGLYPCLQYLIESEGLRFYHAGDTLRYEGMLPRLQAFGRIDAALLPINGRDGKRYRDNCIGNMTFQEAADLAGALSPGLVIPGHWDMFAFNAGDPEAFADYLDAKYPGQSACVIPRHLELMRLQARSE